MLRQQNLSLNEGAASEHVGTIDESKTQLNTWFDDRSQVSRKREVFVREQNRFQSSRALPRTSSGRARVRLCFGLVDQRKRSQVDVKKPAVEHHVPREPSAGHQLP